MFLIPFVLLCLFIYLQSMAFSLRDIKTEKGVDDWQWSEADKRYVMTTNRPMIGYELLIEAIEEDGKIDRWANVTRDMVFQHRYLPKIEIVKSQIRIEVDGYMRLPLILRYRYCGK